MINIQHLPVNIPKEIKVLSSVAMLSHVRIQLYMLITQLQHSDHWEVQQISHQTQLSTIRTYIT